jgi:glycosyltransferase involved in cell wall biosynthesis
MTKRTVLVLVGHFLPGYKAGGPIVSIENLVGALNSDFHFHILTADRDLGDSKPYSERDLASVGKMNNVDVRYLKEGERTFKGICQIISGTKHDILYLNSFFARWCAIYPMLGRRLGLIPRKPIVLAPRGEFSEGALTFKSFKKRSYVKFAKSLSLLEGLKWHASSEYEAIDIARNAGCFSEEISIGPDLAKSPAREVQKARERNTGVLRVLFLSRISPMKNLEFALNVLSCATGEIDFNIVGPIEDHAYWNSCDKIISEMPRNVTVSYHGPAFPGDVRAIMEAHDVLFLPSKGENFGHVIAESLSVGTPVLVSDQTPWRKLCQKKLGHDVSLSQPSEFVKILNGLANLTEEAHQTIRQNTYYAYKHYLAENDGVEKNRKIFSNLL